MNCCPHCGAPRVTAGRFVVEGDPRVITYDGVRLKLPPMRVKMLAHLIEHGDMSHEALQALLTPTAISRVDTAHISYLRGALPPGVRIDSVRGWGYKLGTPAAPASPGPVQPQPSANSLS